jgi:two-component system, NtrC family, sensor histidine kinase PilS
MAPPLPSAERRNNKRRHTDRRYAGRRGNDGAANLRGPDESLFDALGVDSAAVPLADDLSGIDPPRGGPFLSRQAQRIVWQGGSTFERLYETFIGGRAALGIALLLAHLVGFTFGQRSIAGVLVSGAYALQALMVWLLPRWRRHGQPRTHLTRSQWTFTLGVDLVAFALLHVFEAAGNFNYAALLVMPALIGGVLTSRRAALATTAVATLMVIASAFRGGIGSGDWSATLAPAGLTGIGLFVVTLLAGELSGRLAREEQAARGSLEVARQQVALNRLVIEEMTDGVMVIDRSARVRAANPAARRLLVAQGVGPLVPFQLQDEPAWAALRAQVVQAFDAGEWPRHGHDVALPFSASSARTLRVRARFTRERVSTTNNDDEGRQNGAAEALCVLFVEDLRHVQARSRQEKLAAMGRVSAGIAHEIRNPLAAIAQANALLQEEAVGAEQQMLTAMVADNVERLKLIVDDVMEVAPAADPEPRPIDLGGEVGRIVADWARINHVVLGAGSRLHAELPNDALAVLFDAEHLRRVLVNLRRRPSRLGCRWPATVTRSRPTLSHSCSSPSSRRAAAAPGWACTFAGNCASAMAAASTIGSIRPRPGTTMSSS